MTGTTSRQIYLHAGASMLAARDFDCEIATQQEMNFYGHGKSSAGIRAADL